MIISSIGKLKIILHTEAFNMKHSFDSLAIASRFNLISNGLLLIKIKNKNPSLCSPFSSCENFKEKFSFISHQKMHFKVSAIF